MPSWKKVITSGSDASLNSINVTNGLTLTGSLNHFGDYNHTGSVYHSGSKFLTGIFSQTGSLFITGSTTQIGNNTLLGTTTLSGSIIISGSTTIPATPTIKIYGDMETDGVIKFTPVSKNIDTSISASYIYVSGSTNDLYFSQNGSGYNNVTRLRWLEGNLYTGLLNGGLITTQSSTVYQISSGSGIIVDLNASLTDNPYPSIQYLNWGNLSASISAFTASYQQVFVGIDSTGNIFAQGTPFSNGQFDSIINIGGVFFQNQSTINGFKTQPSVAYGFEQQQNTFNRAFGPLKLSGYILSPSASSTGSLIVTSGTAYAPGSNYTVDPNEPYYAVDNGTNVSKIFRYHQSGSTWIYDTNAGVGYATINPGQYSNNGVLTTVQPNDWSIQRVFWFPNSVVKAIVVYYGNASYSTEADAIANISIESFVEAPNTSANAIYLGAIVIRGNGVLTVPADFTIVPGGLFRQVGGSGGGGSIITQTLSGLSDVLISGPTNGQPLVYNNTSTKWQNSSTLIADLTGNASTATSASFASTASNITPAISNDVDTRVLTANGNGTLNAEGNLTFNGQTLSVLYGVGDEGGEILLGKAATNTTLTGSGVTVDVYQNKLRFFEQGGSARGFYLDISTGGGGASTNLASGGGTVTSVDTSGSVSGITLTGGPITGAGTIVLGGTITGLTTSNLSATAGILNAQLANSSITIGSTNIDLGDTATSLTGLASINATAFTGSLFGTASYAETSSYVNTLNQIVNVGTDIQLNNVTGLITANTYDAGLGTILIDGTVPGGLIDLNASTIIIEGDIGNITAATFTGTASYATQALSASYAPGVSKIIAGTNISISPTLGTGDVTINATAADPFPYTGSAIISGSLTVTGSLLITGSATLINQGPTILSGSFKVQGNGDGFTGPFAAITVDDANYTRKLHDSQTGSGSLDFGTRDLLDGTGNGVFNWNGIAKTIDSRLYLNETISGATRNALITNIGYGGFALNDAEFDGAVQTNDLVFLDTDGIWYQVDQTTASSTKMLGICQNYDPMSYIGTVILEGDIIVTTGAGFPQVQGANFGLPVYIREANGTIMSTTSPTTDYVRLLGHCYHYDGGTEWIMKFKPSHEWTIL